MLRFQKHAASLEKLAEAVPCNILSAPTTFDSGQFDSQVGEARRVLYSVLFKINDGRVKHETLNYS